jgi:LuxR family quorum sensing-dependent transcriptional regulator
MNVHISTPRLDRRAGNIRRDALEFIERLDRFGSLESVADATVAMLRRQGVDHLCMSFLPVVGGAFDYAVIADRLPAGMIAYYSERGYHHDDPALRYCKTATGPFRWVREAPYDPEREPRAVKVIEVMREFGLHDGVVIPVRSQRGRMGQVFFGGREITLPMDELRALHFMTLYAFDRALWLRGQLDLPQSVLTPRECEVLTLVASGKSGEQIGEALHISARTVVEHIKHCCRKLGAANRTHAVVIAIRDRLIQP